MARSMPVRAIKPKSRAHRLPRVAAHPVSGGSFLYRNGSRWTSHPMRCLKVSLSFGMSHHLNQKIPAVDAKLQAVQGAWGRAGLDAAVQVERSAMTGAQKQLLTRVPANRAAQMRARGAVDHEVVLAQNQDGLDEILR